MTTPTADTEIDPAKIQAYLQTTYCVNLETEMLSLNIGTQHNTLTDLFSTHAVNCGAFITAYNPEGTVQPSDLNESAHDLLLDRVNSLGLKSLEAHTQTHTEAHEHTHEHAEGSHWPTEHGLFVLGIALEQAQSLARDFDQDALVWVDSDLIPVLILLR